MNKKPSRLVQALKDLRNWKAGDILYLSKAHADLKRVGKDLILECAAEFRAEIARRSN